MGTACIQGKVAHRVQPLRQIRGKNRVTPARRRALSSIHSSGNQCVASTTITPLAPPKRLDRVRAHDVVNAQTQDGRPLPVLELVDEWTCGWQSIDVARTLRSTTTP